MARKARGIYLPLDIEFFDNDKVISAGEKAGWLYIAMCCRSKGLLSDGVLSEQQISRLHIAGWRKRLDTLVDVGLVVLADDGRYIIVGWLERNMSAAQVQAARERDRVRKDSTRNPAGQTADPREVEVEDRDQEEVEVVPTTESARLGPIMRRVV
jgi:hypothetical protein